MASIFARAQGWPPNPRRELQATIFLPLSASYLVHPPRPSGRVANSDRTGVSLSTPSRDYPSSAPRFFISGKELFLRGLLTSDNFTSNFRVRLFNRYRDLHPAPATSAHKPYLHTQFPHVYPLQLSLSPYVGIHHSVCRSSGLSWVRPPIPVDVMHTRPGAIAVNKI